MGMSRMICGKIVRDGTSNHTIRDATGVDKVEEFMRQQKLRWLEYVKRMNHEIAPAKTNNFVVGCSKKSRPKEKWKEVQ